MQRFLYILLLSVFTLVFSCDLSAMQVEQDTLKLNKDTLSLRSAADTSKKNGSLENPAFSTARDSIIEDFSNGKKRIFYYGDVSVRYQDIELKADYMEYNLDTKTVFATGLKDTSGVLKGRPVLKEGSQTYTMESVY